MKRLITIACLAALAGCAGDTDDAAKAQQEQREQWEAQNQSLIYAFPDEGQTEVPVPSPVVLRFSSPVMETAPVITLQEVGGDPVTGLDLEWVDNKRGMIITPDSNLKPMTDYVVQIPAIELEKGIAPARTIAFSTRALFEGPRSQVGGETFEITRMIPDGEQYQIMDFSSFRLQFSQPLDRGTVKYGNSAESTVQLMGPNGLVDAHLLVSGRYMTIDPKSELTPGADYALNITTGLASIYGDTLPGGGFGNPGGTLAVSFPITPQNTGAPGTGERVSMVQDVADTGETSPLTGMPINLVPMASVLLGEDTATQASGTLAAELAFAPHFPDETPFRVKRGSLIEGASIDVRIGGEVPAGFDSGDVRIEFLSDAVGYLLPSPYSNLDDVPRQVRLFMDVSVSTATPSANGAITQNMLHIELVGTAIVEEGQMVINAVGVVEPNVLGSERAKGLLSFYMKAFEDQDNPPVVIGHSTSPVLQSWTLGTNALTGENKALQAKPGDPLIFNFDQALDPESVAGNVRLFHNNAPMDIEYFADGAALVVKPAAVREESNEGTTITRPGFQLSPADAPNIYRVEVDGATNLAGDMAVDLPLVEEFELATIVPDYDLTSPELAPDFTTSVLWRDRRETPHSPVILAAYPGFPCALQEEFIEAGGYTGLFDGTTDIGQTYRDLAGGVAGMCAGGAPEITDGLERDNRAADDRVPVMDMPANRPIIIAFGKEIDTSTIVLGETLVVERIDENEQPLGNVAGTVEISDMTLYFRPTDPWQEGELYRYTLKSSGWAICRSSGSNPTHRLVANDATEIEPCVTSILADHRTFQCGVDAVCDTEGLPVRTMPLGINTMRKLSSPSASAIRHYRWGVQGPSATSGGPDMTHFFRGTTPSDHVLQVLRTQPVADTNRNFISERSNIGAGDLDAMLAIRDVGAMFGLGSESWDIISSGEFDYPVEEYGPEGPLEAGSTGLYPAYDPDGRAPAKNSVKVLSRFDSQGTGFDLSGANVGCSHDSDVEFDPAVGFSSEIREPFECPENKFSYLMSAVIAEVTDEVTAQGVKVKLWPSVVMGTSLDLFIRTDFLGAFDYMAGTLSGAQILRMRYSGDHGNEAITGWISEQDQRAVMRSDMELYMDAPYASEWAPINNPINLISYPIQMSLEGEVNFFDDGRMEVEQYNINLINLDAELWTSTGAGAGEKSGYIDLFIPEYGSRINMISEPIK
ncbi:Ig-like domain-containing protein [Alcanivorax sp. JB21]|uniref:Ig-like domain-containing protein n=1 Tax=Alcanivorax limicola TaxID=2874102 RepID=UPI001CBE7C04|nr:Ig-like domain-containing protein [Alcanivorax limicola]MBZ2188525.1 Ig-like domain-containing protein [Alcanivorax limicola]